MSLDALRAALAARLAAHPEVAVGALHTELAEFVTLTVEPAQGPHRFLRAAVAPLGGAVAQYTMRWSSYRGASASDDCDGGTVGDLAFALSAIDHWILEGRPWREVPEFSADQALPGEPSGDGRPRQ
jgi:hypothetical protein